MKVNKNILNIIKRGIALVGTVTMIANFSGCSILGNNNEDEVSYSKESISDNIISVKDFNARGDGVTDDLEAINKAIESSDDATIYFPSGDYVITDSIIISKSNIKLLGGDNVTIRFSNNIDLNDKHIVGAVVVKTVDKDIYNVSLENLTIDVGASKDKCRKESSLGRGITVIRQGKHKNTKDYYEMKNIKINNCHVLNAYSYGIATVGGEQLKKGYANSIINDLRYSYQYDYDNRMYYNYYNIENLEISGCRVENSRIGIRVNRVSNADVSNNYVDNSYFENITIQGENIKVGNNKLYSHSGGCGNLCIDKSDNVYIFNNYIDENKSITSNDIWKTGICQNSAAGASYNVTISNNYINGASRGIWLKDHRMRANPHGKNDTGSRPGAGFIIKDNVIKNSKITDIRIDELLENRVDTLEYIGKSYLYNKYNNSVNLESYYNSFIGSNIPLDSIKFLENVKPSLIKISKIDELGNYISGSKLQIIDEFNNVYGNYISRGEPINVDLELGNYKLIDLDSNETTYFSVDNDNYTLKDITVKIENKNKLI